MRISDWSSDVCSSDLEESGGVHAKFRGILPGSFMSSFETVGIIGKRRDPQVVPTLMQLLEILRALGREICVEDVTLPGVELPANVQRMRSEEHTSELQSLMRISYAVFCLKKKNNTYIEGNQ